MDDWNRLDDDELDRNVCKLLEELSISSNHCLRYRFVFTDDLAPVQVPIFSCVGSICVVVGWTTQLQGKTNGIAIPPEGGSGDDWIAGARSADLIGQGSGTATSAASSATRSGSRWVRAEVLGRRVYQRDDLIDPDMVVAGRSNLERMKDGVAPIGLDGKPINLHHALQTEDSALLEITSSMHLNRPTRSIVHINPPTIRSGIDRRAFNDWKREYWIRRACDFGGC